MVTLKHKEKNMKTKISLFAIVFFLTITGCTTKTLKKANVEDLTNAPTWVKEEAFQQGKIVASAKNDDQAVSFREKRDSAYKNSKENLKNKITLKIDNLFTKLNTDQKHNYNEEKIKSDIIENTMKLAKMEDIYETNVGNIYIKSYIPLNSFIDSVDDYFKRNLQKYTTLYANYLILKNNSELYNILTN